MIIDIVYTNMVEEGLSVHKNANTNLEVILVTSIPQKSKVHEQAFFSLD